MDVTTGNLKSLSTQTLRTLIDETETALDDLNAEVERRENAAQHTQIENLETHMKSAELSVRTIRDFLSEMVAELRGEKR